MSVPELSVLSSIRDAADKEAERFPASGEGDGHRDAFRHTYATVLMAGAFGEEFTRRFTSAHEARPDNPARQEAMDLHNNEVGRRIAAENLDADELAERVERAVEHGGVVVIDGDGRLNFSDRVPLGETGRAPRQTRPGGQPLERPDEGYDPGYGVTG